MSGRQVFDHEEVINHESPNIQQDMDGLIDGLKLPEPLSDGEMPITEKYPKMDPNVQLGHHDVFKKCKDFLSSEESHAENTVSLSKKVLKKEN